MPRQVSRSAASVMSWYWTCITWDLVHSPPLPNLMSEAMMVVNAHVVGELVVIEALGALDRLLEHLKIGIAPPAEVITEWVDTLARRKRLVFLEEIRGRRHQFRRRHPELVVHNAVELGFEFTFDGSVLQSDHAAAHHLRLQT